MEEEGQVEDVEGHGCQEGVSLQKEETKEKNLTYLLFHHELEPFADQSGPSSVILKYSCAWSLQSITPSIGCSLLAH